MVIHELQAVFVHVPKTAGIAITHAIMPHLVGYDTADQIGNLSEELKIRFEMRGAQKHKKARDYVPDDISQKHWNRYWKFAVVRNPWDRVISEFHWRQTLRSRHPSTDFNEFLDYTEARLNGWCNDIYRWHAWTQKSYVTDTQGNVILDDVFRFEELDSAIEKIQEWLGLPLDVQRRNTSEHDHYRTYYTEATKARVAQLYAEDIEFFGYEF